MILVVAGVGVSSSGDITGTNLVTAGIYVLATISGFVAPLMLSRIGHRGLAMWGFGLAFIGLVVGAFALKYDWKIVIVLAACVLMWGHYWDASNGMTINSMVAPPRFKATASGFAYVFVKAASFFGAFIFPIMNEAWGKFGATLAVSVLSAIGFLSAKFILPEMWGYVEQEEQAAAEAALGASPGQNRRSEALSGTALPPTQTSMICSMSFRPTRSAGLQVKSGSPCAEAIAAMMRSIRRGFGPRFTCMVNATKVPYRAAAGPSNGSGSNSTIAARLRRGHVRRRASG